MGNRNLNETCTDLDTVDIIRESLCDDDDMDKRTFKTCLDLLSRVEGWILSQYKPDQSQEV